MAKVELDVQMPDSLLQSFLQHLRDWEAQHMKETAFMIWIADCKFPGDQMLAVFQSIKPPYTEHVVFPGARGRVKN